MIDRSLPYLVNCSLMFTEEPLLRRPAAARAAGFSAVEFWWPFATPVPPDRDVDTFVAAVQEAGVALVGLNFFAGDLAGRDRRHRAHRAGQRAQALSAAHGR
jgi:hydroxypyruvate isomerase